MKILIINDFGVLSGGAEIQAFELRDNLRQAGHDVKIFSSSAKPVNTRNQADYICFGTSSWLGTVTQVFNPLAAKKIRQILQDFQPDIIHVKIFLWQMSPLILPIIRSYPVLLEINEYKVICPVGTRLLPSGKPCQEDVGVACFHNHCLPEPHRWLLWMIQYRLWWRWRGFVDYTVTLSNRSKQLLATHGIPIDEIIFNSTPYRQARKPLGDIPIVGYVGRIIPEKGVDILLCAFAIVLKQIPNAQLWIAGYGTELDNLRELARQLEIDDNIQWLGYVTRAEIETLFDEVWVQVVPSLWEEVFGNITIEGMMRGTAMIGSAVGGMIDCIVDGETGYLFPAGNDSELAERIMTLCSDRDLTEKFGQQGRERCLTHFTAEHQIRQYERVYHHLLEQHNKRSL